MRLFNHKKNLLDFIQGEREKNHTIGLVPTMGALHQGHITLVQKALLENDGVVVSIFVNPTQFNRKDDLEKYPRNLEQDVAQLQHVSEKIVVFAPSVDEIYGNKVTSQPYDFEGLDKGMEGAFRAGHFEGVATIVELLLRMVTPDKAYFGEKDFQQLQIVRKMVEQKAIPCAIIGCSIKRETNGLAMSSRNERLSKPTREEAGLIHQTLCMARSKFKTESAEAVTTWVTAQFKNHSVFTLEYFQITDEDTLTPLINKQDNTMYRAFIAVYAEGIRLIDNVQLY